jgi:ATP-dependent DNA helicase RecQ
VKPSLPRFTHSPKRSKTLTSKPEIVDAPLDSSAALRFERLKKVRRQLADQQQWPAFCIMHDSTLKEVARRSPSSIQELALIKGIGDKKAVHFGPALLNALKD